VTLFVLYYYMVLDDPKFITKLPPYPAGFKVPTSIQGWSEEKPNFYNTKSGVKMSYMKALPQGQPKAVVFIVPGYGAHVRFLGYFANMFVKNGYVVYGLEPEGSGSSSGLRAYIHDFNKTCDDIHELMLHLKAQHSNLKSFVWGESAGGAMSLNIAIKNPKDVDGLLLFAPAILIGDNISPWLRKIAEFVSNIFPTLPLGGAVSDEILCTDDAVHTMIKHDEMGYKGRIRARTGAQFLKAFEYLENNLHRLITPFITFHGELDHIIKMDSSRALIAKAKSTDKTIKEYPNERHILPLSKMYKELGQEALAWVQKRT